MPFWLRLMDGYRRFWEDSRSHHLRLLDFLSRTDSTVRNVGNHLANYAKYHPKTERRLRIRFSLSFEMQPTCVTYFMLQTSSGLLNPLALGLGILNLCKMWIFYVNVYSSPNIVRVIKSRRMRWAGHVARMGEERGVYRVLVGKPEGKRPLGRPRRRRVDNIRMDLQEVGCRYMDWIGLAQDRDRWRTLVECGNEPSGSVKCGEFLD